jgi:hypothetical protein
MWKVERPADQYVVHLKQGCAFYLTARFVTLSLQKEIIVSCRYQNLAVFHDSPRQMKFKFGTQLPSHNISKGIHTTFPFDHVDPFFLGDAR